MPPRYDFDKIKFATDPQTFEKAVALYEDGKVTKFKKELNGYFAIVRGGSAYNVYVSNRHYDEGDCTCYLGQNETLCKHMVAVAIHAAADGKSLTEKEKLPAGQAQSSGRAGSLAHDELARTKKAITSALRLIKGYDGPSSTWLRYQDSLSEGANRLAMIISELPASEQTARILVDLLLRLEKKVMNGGVDDSDGTVGNCMQAIVAVLEDYAKLDPRVIKSFEKLQGLSTSFEWEKPLVALFKTS